MGDAQATTRSGPANTVSFASLIAWQGGYGVVGGEGRKNHRVRRTPLYYTHGRGGANVTAIRIEVTRLRRNT
jgi:hypothetical protein